MKNKPGRILSFFLVLFITVSCSQKILKSNIINKAELVLKDQVKDEAKWAMQQQPITVTSSSSVRSAGDKNDFYSEGDYWWPDPQNPDGPYIQKDGMTNPDNFIAHRLAMIRFSKIIGSLATAYKVTGDEKYVKYALLHLNAWFVNKETMMSPHLLYAQAIKGRFTGRGIGIIDTLHLIDVAQGIIVMQSKINNSSLSAIKSWFTMYLSWLMSHPYGEAEMNAKNNHGTCFILQVASFSKLTGDEKLMKFCRDRYKNVLLPNQMAVDGSFPLEMARTKPYGYAIFNLDAMTTLCQALSTKEDDLFTYQTVDGRSIKKGIEFLYPFIVDKSKWPLKPDVMYWEEWPVAQPFLIFGANAYKNENWFNIWRALEHKPAVEEVVRNLPVKYPLIWLN